MAESSSESLHVSDQGQLEQEEDQQAEPNMSEFFERYAPINPSLIQAYDSELDFLRSVTGFRDYCKQDEINFNYYFTEDSYAIYTKEELALRLELTYFREAFLNEYNLKVKDIPGYYYELGRFETEKCKPSDYDDGTDKYRPRQEGRRRDDYRGRRH